MIECVSPLQEPLPAQPLSGMLNKHGNKVRLHFKTGQDELWIGTKGKLNSSQTHTRQRVMRIDFRETRQSNSDFFYMQA